MNQVFQQILQKIKEGEFKPGETLPPLGELQQMFNAGEDEVRTAVSELIYEGFLERAPGGPREVVRVPPYELWCTLGGIHSITQEARKRGQEPGTKVLFFDILPVWPTVAERLQLGPDEEVVVMERLRTVDGKPVAIETSYLPARLMPGITKEMFEVQGAGQSSFEVMQKKYGLKPHRATDELTVAAVEKREAELLGLEEGTPILVRFRITYSEDGTAIKCSRALWKLKAGYQMDLE